MNWRQSMTWEDNYIGWLRRNRRSAPTFPIALWNMWSCVADGLPRTNNSVERWHHAFQSSVSCYHPNIYKLIKHIQAWQDHTEQLIARFNAGDQTAVSSENKYSQVTRRLTALLPIRMVPDRFRSSSEVLHTTLNFKTLIGVTDVLVSFGSCHFCLVVITFICDFTLIVFYWLQTAMHMYFKITLIVTF